jgi:hypothetical protein
VDLGPFLEEPPQPDGDEAARWRGPIFLHWEPPAMWKDGGAYKFLERPRHVTFPICDMCEHVIWTAPHFDEEIHTEICDRCYLALKEENERE